MNVLESWFLLNMGRLLLYCFYCSPVVHGDESFAWVFFFLSCVDIKNEKKFMTRIKNFFMDHGFFKVGKCREGSAY